MQIYQHNSTSLLELHELVRYLRHEKKILDQRVDVADKEAQRYRQQAELSARARDEARTLLAKEKERTSAPITEAELKAQQTQLRQLQLVQESNTTLRDQYQARTQEFGKLCITKTALLIIFRSTQNQIRLFEKSAGCGGCAKA